MSTGSEYIEVLKYLGAVVLSRLRARLKLMREVTVVTSAKGEDGGEATNPTTQANDRK